MYICHFIPNNGVGGVQSVVRSISCNNDVIFYFKNKSHVKINNEYNIFSFKFLEVLFSSRYRIFHTHGHILTHVFFFFAFIFNKFLFHTIHNEIKREAGKRRRYLHYFFSKIKTIQFILISNKFVDDFMLFYPGALYKVIHNSSSFDRVFDSSNKNKDHFNILFAGRFDYQKNVEKFLTIAEQLPSIYQIKIVGDFMGKYSLIENFEHLENVSFYKEVNGLHDFIDWADFIVSTSRFEGLPILLLESLVSNKYYVSTNVGGVSEFIHDEFLFDDVSDFVSFFKSVPQMNFPLNNFYKFEREYCLPSRAILEHHTLYNSFFGKN